ncbi:MAG TPA: hypothetical protein VNZ62_17360 [Capillimicrobium sp.]|nr:hypothetical protein [Capillimicrobium sp.]
MAAELTVRAREPRAPARTRRLPAVLARVPWPMLAILAAGLAWTIWFVLQCQQYFIQPDELEYVKQSRLIAEKLRPLVPSDAWFNSWSQLQAILLAPVWAIRDTNLAHQLMGVVNAIIMVSAAIPAYLLTRRVVGDRRWAYLVALLTVGLPWIGAAATMMTEVAAYPAFLWGVLAVQHAIARPSTRGDAIGVAGVALAYFARPQLAVLAAGLIGGLLLQELRYGAEGDPLEPRRARLARGLKAAAWRHRWLLGALAVGVVLYLVLRPNLFGGYTRSGVTSGLLDAPGLLDFSRELLAYVAVGVAVLPLGMAIAWALLTFARPLDRDQHAFALVAVITGVLLTIVVGSFTARYTPQGINSRYLFYLAPLLLIGMAALIADRRPATWPLVAGAAVTGWLVFGAALSQSGPSLVSPDQTFHTVLIGRTQQLGKAIGMPELTYPHLLAVLAVAVLLALAVVRRGPHARSAGLAIAAVVAVFCLAETGYSLRKIADTQAGVSTEFIEGRHWIDEAMPDGETAQLIVSTLGDPGASYGVWWDTSFWNSSVDRTMALPTMPDLQQPFPQAFQLLPDGTFAGYTWGLGPDSIGGPGLGDGPWFVRATSDRSFAFRDAEVVAERFGVELVRTTTPPRWDWALSGTFDDTGRILRGAPAALLLVAPREGGETEIPVRLTLGALPGAERGTRFVVGDRRGRVEVGETVEVDAVARLSGGLIQLPIEAPGEPDPARGIQVLGVQVL